MDPEKRQKMVRLLYKILKRVNVAENIKSSKEEFKKNMKELLDNFDEKDGAWVNSIVSTMIYGATPDMDFLKKVFDSGGMNFMNAGKKWKVPETRNLDDSLTFNDIGKKL
jgi:hypothetical protein